MNAPLAAEKLQAKFGEAISDVREFRDETTVIVDREKIFEICKACRDDLGFDHLVDICSVDNMGEDPRFEVVYHLYSYKDLCTLRIKAPVSEDDATIDSVTALWDAADWHEREAYDMMGIKFNNHPELRRILMWDGFPYYPLRKDFPLAGKPSEMPDVAFSNEAPLEGGPFVTCSGGDAKSREPRSRG